MPHTYCQNAVHIVFSTKDRRASISSEFQPELWSYLSGICKRLNVHLHAAGGTENHVHLLVEVPPTLSISKVVLTIKSNSSRWANEKGHRFAWQQGYGAFSVSRTVIPAVIRYIQNQKIHHKKIGFEAEFTEFLKKHGIEFDPKFVFD
jgi:REP element-mobilizing transposase RayT